jgi:flagellin-like hook-associated protein FlgL
VTLSPTATLNTLNFANGDTVEITADGVTTTYTVANAATETVADLVAGLNANANASVTLGVSGKIEIEALGSGDLTLSEGSQGTNLDDLGLTAGTTTFTASPDRRGFSSQYDVLLNQITQLAHDAKFNAVNLLDGDTLTVVFNEDSSSKLVLAGVDFTASGLGLSASSDSFQGDLELNTVLAALDTATATLRQQASTFGSNLNIVEVRRDFTKNLINTLETGAANLTLADSNEEGANLLALQTRQQLSSTALSMASQADQNVLRLFQ